MPRLRRLSLSAIEALEQRIVPTVTIQAGVDLDADGNADDVKIVGGNESSRVYIRDEGNGAGSLRVSVDINGDGDFGDAGEMENHLVTVSDDSCVIDLAMGGGNDLVNYETTDNLLFSNRHLSIDLGSGNDQLVLNYLDDTINTGSVILVDLLAGSGNDQLTVIVPTVKNSDLTIDAVMGTGNDDVFFSNGSATPVDIDNGAVLDFNIDLGSGTNKLQAGLLLNVGIATRGAVNLDAIGGSGVDEVYFIVGLNVGNGTLNSNVTLNAELGGGNDRFASVHQRLDVEVDSTVSVRTSGGAGNDELSVGLADPVDSSLKGIAQYDLLGGLGDDKVVSFFVGNNPAGQLTITGQLKINLFGQEGNDQMAAVLLTTAASTGNFSLVALGGAGNDTVGLQVISNSAPLMYGRSGKLTLDGGKGTDGLGIEFIPLGNVDARFFEFDLT